MSAFALAPHQALATPPDVIDIREEPFGINDTHLFVIRSSSDNLGLYESLRAENFLVAIDLQTGAEEFWVLDRLTQSSDYDEDGELLGYKVKRDEGLEPVNPFAILAERKAMPWSAVSFAGAGWKVPDVKQADGTLSAVYADGRKFGMRAEALASRLKNVGAFMTANVVDYGRMSTISTRQLFEERVVPVDSCKPERVLEFFAMGGQKPFRFVRVNCTDPDDIGITSIIVKLDAAS